MEPNFFPELKMGNKQAKGIRTRHFNWLLLRLRDHFANYLFLCFPCAATMKGFLYCREAFPTSNLCLKMDKPCRIFKRSLVRVIEAIHLQYMLVIFTAVRKYFRTFIFGELEHISHEPIDLAITYFCGLCFSVLVSPLCAHQIWVTKNKSQLGWKCILE